MSRRYIFKNIRTLLKEGFTAQELRNLCFDEPDFRPVFFQLAENSSRAEIAVRLLEYAEQNSQIETLLDLAKRHNPARYAEHQPYYVVLDLSAKLSNAHSWMPVTVALVVAVVALVIACVTAKTLQLKEIAEITPTIILTKTLTPNVTYIPIRTEKFFVGELDSSPTSADTPALTTTDAAVQTETLAVEKPVPSLAPTVTPTLATTDAAMQTETLAVEKPVPSLTPTVTPTLATTDAAVQTETLAIKKPVPSLTPTVTPTLATTDTSVSTVTPTQRVDGSSTRPCPHRVLVLIRPFENKGGENRNVERSIFEAFEKSLCGLVKTGVGQINIQITDSLSLTATSADLVFGVRGWYDSEGVHANISRQNETDDQSSPSDCCPPGNANEVTSKVVVKISCDVMAIWEEKKCFEAAHILLLGLIGQAKIDEIWVVQIIKFVPVDSY